jgi:hypothetical protein
MTNENLRYHAAGHLAAAVLLACEHPEAARTVLRDVKRFARHEKVSAPPQLLETLDAAYENPAGCVKEMTMLETWFVDPLNTLIEKSGGRF